MQMHNTFSLGLDLIQFHYSQLRLFIISEYLVEFRHFDLLHFIV